MMVIVENKIYTAKEENGKIFYWIKAALRWQRTSKKNIYYGPEVWQLKFK